MHELTLLATIAGSFIVLIISPGPNFLVITQMSISQSRWHGILTGLGVASGSIIWATLAATGLGLTFQKLPLLQPVLQFTGSFYLAWIGITTLLNAGQEPKPRDLGTLRLPSLGQVYRFGLMTNLTNPKALAFYTSIFTTVTAPGLALWVRVAGVGVIASLAISWFVSLATLFSLRSVQNRYRHAKKTIDLVTGSLMIAFGIHLLTQLFKQLKF